MVSVWASWSYVSLSLLLFIDFLYFNIYLSGNDVQE